MGSYNEYKQNGKILYDMCNCPIFPRKYKQNSKSCGTDYCFVTVIYHLED